MEIAVISDSHDNLANIYKMLDYLKRKKIKIMIHCGDVCAPGVMKEMTDKFDGEIHLVFGNVDGDREKMKELESKLDNLTIHGQVGQMELGGKKIAWCHYPWQAEELAASKKYDEIFYGHDHRPWEKKIGKTTVRNPGTLAGLFAKATFAVYNTKTGRSELMLLERM